MTYLIYMFCIIINKQLKLNRMIHVKESVPIEGQ